MGLGGLLGSVPGESVWLCWVAAEMLLGNQGFGVQLLDAITGKDQVLGDHSA